MDTRSRFVNWKSCLVGCLWMLSTCVYAASTTIPKVSIIIDNLGDQKQAGLQAVRLPGDIGCSILPHAHFTAMLADECHRMHKVVILNVPMQAIRPFKLGPGGLHMDMSKAEFVNAVNGDLAALPYAQGLDNHMGSMLTTSSERMTWLMETIKPHDLFFLDNHTAPHSVIGHVAAETGVPAIGRDVFLDDVRTPEAVGKQFNEMLRIAKRYGSAVAVGRADAVTLNYLAQELPRLSSQGYQLVSITELMPKYHGAQGVETAANNIPTNSMPAKAKPAISHNVMAAAEPVIKPAPVIAPISPVVKPEKAVIKQAPPVVRQPQVVRNVAKPAPAAEPTQQALNATVVKPKTAHNKSAQPIIVIGNDLSAQVVPTANIQPLQPEQLKKKQQEIPITTPAQNLVQINTNQPENHMIVFDDKKPAVVAPKVVVAKPVATTNKPVKTAGFFAGFHGDICKIYSRACAHNVVAIKPIVAKATEVEPPFDALQGKLPWPTLGDISIHYGATMRQGGMKSTGVLIRAPLGQPVRAIYPGRVVFANWLPGFGLLMIVDHGDGYMSLYGHNQTLYKKVGDAVKPDEMIAAVGNSGREAPTGLYFEIRHNSEPVNPQVWCVSESMNQKSVIG